MRNSNIVFLIALKHNETEVQKGSFMALDPEIDVIIKAAFAAGGRSICTMPVPEARAAYRERYRMRGPAHIDLPRVHDFTVASDPGSLTCRLYVPKTPSSAPLLPLILYFHGGGFVVGDIEAYDLQSRLLAKETGALVLVPDYRLAPEHPFPAALEDAETILEWVFGNAASLDADPARIVVAGDSAGGNLAAHCTRLARARSLPLAGQALFYPVTDFTTYAGGARYPSVEAFSSGYFLDRVMMEWFMDLYLPERPLARDLRASPILAPDFEGQAPALIVTAGFDPLRDMGHAYAERLSQAGVAVRTLCFDTLIHNFLGMIGGVEAAAKAFHGIVEDLRGRLLKPGPG